MSDLDKLRREQARGQLGDAGLRDPDAICAFFWPENTDRLDLRIPECSGDGHYLCHECRNFTGDPR